MKRILLIETVERLQKAVSLMFGIYFERNMDLHCRSCVVRLLENNHILFSAIHPPMALIPDAMIFSIPNNSWVARML